MHLTKNVKACKRRSLHTILMTLDAKTCTEIINPNKLQWTLKHARRTSKNKWGTLKDAKIGVVGQVRLGWVRLGWVRLGKVRLGQA